MTGKVFRVAHKTVGDYHVFFVPKDDPDALGAGLVVSNRDRTRARELLDVALATAKRFGLVPQDATLARGPDEAVSAPGA